MGKGEILMVGVMLVWLVSAACVMAFFSPTVLEEISLPETEIEGKGSVVITSANASANESEKTGIPKWWHWSEEEWEKFKAYANQTEVIWVYDNYGKKIGGAVRVAGEPLCKEYGTEFEFYKIAPGYKGGPSPVWYLETKRKGNCGIVPKICHMLFKVKGEEVIEESARNVDYNPDPRYLGDGHHWVKWTDKNGSEWIIDYNNVWPKEWWYQKYNWTVEWSQYEL